MKLQLKEFQEGAVDKLRALAARASATVVEDGPQSLVLAAPTGSGKTVIASAWMEALVEGGPAFGDDTIQYAEDPDATFLWLTYSPDLNEQTRRKLHKSSTTFRGYELITIGPGFHSRVFEPRKIYFLNTGKLAKGKSLVQSGEHRTYTIWDTIANTAAERPDSFWVVIDEAHQGMAENANAVEEAQSIMQKFIKGSPGELPPLPLVLGLSATPERFTNLLANTERTNRPAVIVKPDDVRKSGLIKDAITLYHPETAQPSDFTLLREAADQLKRYTNEWHAYSVKEQAPVVHPVLVVQVEDASASSITKTDLDTCLSVVEDVLGPLGSSHVGHSFQEKQSVLTPGERPLRYVAPADIEDDTDLRVVFFKQSLTTGWDCPRAEVMMSFRRAIDKVAIAQLVGRMVRTPLARSVDESDFLNSVCLYLPYYDKESLAGVIEYLTDPDPHIGLGGTVNIGNNLVPLTRNPATAEAFAAAAKLSVTRIELISKQSNIRRLLKLGRLLAWDLLDAAAPSVFTKALVDVLQAERNRVVNTQEFADRVSAAEKIGVRAVTVAYGSTTPKAEASTSVAAEGGNIDHAFEQAGRKLGGGLHMDYLRARVDEGESVRAVKVELFALLQDDAVLKAVESVAGELLKDALEAHKVAVLDLPEERRQLYRKIRRQAAKPAPEPWELPNGIDGQKTGSDQLPGHMFVNADGEHFCTLNGWERDALNAAFEGQDVVGWLRNEPRKPWAFSIPYDNERAQMYPDFLVFRRQGEGIVCDVLEPHTLSMGDSPAKASGLAEFARDCGDEFGRIWLIAKHKGSYKALKLDDIDVRDKVIGVSTIEHLKQLFDDI